MKIRLILFLLYAFLLVFIISACQDIPTETTNPTATVNENLGLIVPTPTPTPTIIVPDLKTTAPIQELTGTLEIRFPDPWERPEFCSSEIPYKLTLTETTYELTGEGNFYCYQFMTYEEGIKHHAIQDYTISLSGSKPIEIEGILEVALVIQGYQENYFTDMPPGAPEIITPSNPFHVDIDNQSLSMRFRYADGAYCIWNQNGVFTSLPGEEPPVGEDGWLFILHPTQD